MRAHDWIVFFTLVAGCGGRLAATDPSIEGDLRRRCGDGICRQKESCDSCPADCGSCAPFAAAPPPCDGCDGIGASGNIGDGDVQIVSVRQIMPDGFGAFEIFYGLREPWNVDMTRMMFLEDENVQHPDGQWGAGLVWANVADLKSWTSVSEYRSIRHAMNPYPYQYAGDFEWSPFPGEENIVYGARFSDRMVVKRNLDTGVEEDLISYDPGNGNEPRPLIRRWTTDNHLIVLLDGQDNLDPWVNGAYEVDVQARTRRYFGPPTYNSNWELSPEDRARWPQVASHGHGGLSPDRTMYFGAGYLSTWPAYDYLGTYAANLTYSSFNHVSWRSSNAWWVTEDHGMGYLATGPLVDTFGLWQCHTDGTCRHLLDVRSATFWDPAGANWPGGPLPTLRRDGRQLVYVSTDGQYSKLDFDLTGAAPWGAQKMFLADLAPR